LAWKSVSCEIGQKTWKILDLEENGSSGKFLLNGKIKIFRSYF
jgi:hypothetical protein